MKCPHCGKEIKDPKQPYRPFCSNRCKLIDLGKWISEEYRVPDPGMEEDEIVDQSTLNDAGEE